MSHNETMFNGETQLFYMMLEMIRSMNLSSKHSNILVMVLIVLFILMMIGMYFVKHYQRYRQNLNEAKRDDTKV